MNPSTSDEPVAARQYTPFRLHPELFGGTFREEWLHPHLLQILQTLHDDSSENSSIDPKSLVPYLHEEAPEIYSFHCFSPIFLQLFNEELAHFYQVCEKHQIPIRRPNSMNNYGVVLNEIGMRSMLTALQKIIWPLSHVLFPLQSMPQFDDHHSFLIRYSAKEDLGLDMHIDDSDVTLNICLGEPNFTKATLIFCGNFGSGDHRRVSHTYHHQVGRAVMHLGTRRHGAEDIGLGSRINLILWNINFTYRKSSSYDCMRNLQSYQVEDSPPDRLCLSYTHDRDYSRFKTLPRTIDPQSHRPWCPPPGKEYEGFHHDDHNDINNNEERVKEELCDPEK